MRSAYERDVKGQDKTKVFDDSYACARNEISLVTSVGTDKLWVRIICVFFYCLFTNFKPVSSIQSMCIMFHISLGNISHVHPGNRPLTIPGN